MGTIYETGSRLANLRQGLADLAVSLNPTHLVTAMLRPGRSKQLLEGTIHEWNTRTNRRYLGRDWYKDRFRSAWMSGIVFFEQGRSGTDPHVHMIIRPPRGATALDFERSALYDFNGEGELLGSPARAIIAPAGSMKVQRLGPTEEDIRRVVSYGTKELPFRLDAYEEWNTIDGLRRMSIRA